MSLENISKVKKRIFSEEKLRMKLVVSRKLDLTLLGMHFQKNLSIFPITYVKLIRFLKMVSSPQSLI